MSVSTSPSNGKTPSSARSATSALPDIPGLGGAIAGIVGGLAMIVVAAMLSISLGHDIWQEPRQIATIFYGPAALAPGAGFAPVIAGTIVHFAISAALGAIFGIVSRRMLRLPSDYGVPVVAGLIYGLLVWMVAFFAFLPVFIPALLDTYAPSFIIQNLVYGAVTGLVYSQLRPQPYNDVELDSALAPAIK